MVAYLSVYISMLLVVHYGILLYFRLDYDSLRRQDVVALSPSHLISDTDVGY